MDVMRFDLPVERRGVVVLPSHSSHDPVREAGPIRSLRSEQSGRAEARQLYEAARLRHVGVVRIDLSGDVAYLRRVAIDEPWQRQGLGRLLLALAESFAIEHGAQRLESSVAVDAVAFYAKCGYRSRQSDAGNVDTHMFKDLA